MADPKVLPNLTQNQLVDLAWSRITEFFITDTRTQRIGDRETINWKAGILNRDAIYRGDWVSSKPDKTNQRKSPRTLNMLQSGTDDLARIAGESQAAGFSPPKSSSSKDIHSARVREAIGKTYWMKNRGDSMLPYLVQDLAVTGMCAMAAVHPDMRKGYPQAYRLDPRGCYPDVINGQLQDMVVIGRIRKRQAEFLIKKDLGSWASDTDDIEMIDYYHPMGVSKVLTKVSNDGPAGTPFMASQTRYELNAVPVGFYMLPAADGQFHGIFDQILGLMQTQHQIADLMIDYANQGVYAPWFEYGVSNATELPGPKTIYHSIDEKGRMDRVQPAISSPQLYQMLDWIESQTRAGAFQPQSRAGQVDQSIASGEFVNSTQGGLTSLSRGVLRGLAEVRSQWTSVALQLDSQFGNTEKALYRPVGNTYTYTPKKDIDGVYDFDVTYGTGAGLDYLNRKAAIEQEMGAGLISKETGRAQMDDIADPEGEKMRIDREMVEQIYVQKALASDDAQTLADLMALMNKGKTLFEAATEAAAEAAARQQQLMQQAQQPEEAGEQGQPGLPPPAGQAGAPQLVPGPASPASSQGQQAQEATNPFAPSQPLSAIRQWGAA